MNEMTTVKRLFGLCIGLSIVCLSCAHLNEMRESTDLRSWPAGASPREIGKRVAERFLETPFGGFNRSSPPESIPYPEVCAWYGALTFARLAGDTQLQSKLVERFEPLLNEKKNLIPAPDHVDNTVFAAVPLELYIQTGEQRYLDLGVEMADKQWGAPFGPNVSSDWAVYSQRGFTWQTRIWIDDMYMITAVQAQAYRATGNRTFIDRAAREMAMYLDSLQKPNGLFYHAPDVPFFWGRGNGWMAAGMSELLRSLPEDSPYRDRILRGYRTMMASLLKFQDQSGLWHQIIDHPESWEETSCTGMFTFAMITGVKNGWLDATLYAPVARKGWLGLMQHLDANADINDVCEGTAKKNDLEYYLARKRNTGDLHGQAPLLWCASALLR
jgi:unsaturated rhamnogalacturonyl hydrolase